MKKRIFAVLPLTFYLFAFNQLFAQEKETPASFFKYELNNEGNGIVITEYVGIPKDNEKYSALIGKDLDIVVPAMIDGKPVVEVRGFSKYIEDLGYFKHYTGHYIVTLTFPDSIREISEDLGELPNLEKIILPKYLKELPDGMFDNSYSGSISRPFAHLKEIILPEVLEIIPENCFKETDIETIKLPKTLKRIEKSAFSNCSYLKNIIIPENLEYIGNSAFYWCRNLKSVTIPTSSSLAYIGSWAFNYCKNLKSIALPEGFVSIGFHAFEDCEKLSSIVLPKTLLEIGSGVFRKSGIEQLVLPEGIEKIESEAFEKCTRLKAIVLPESIEYIGTGTFKDCILLSLVTLPNKQVRYGYDYLRKNHTAFKGCLKLSKEEKQKISDSGYIGEF